MIEGDFTAFKQNVEDRSSMTTFNKSSVSLNSIAYFWKRNKHTDGWA